jgi:hypothetical protein
MIGEIAAHPAPLQVRSVRSVRRAALPVPDKEAQALGVKRYQAFLDSVAKIMAKGADNDNELPEATRNDGFSEAGRRLPS